MPSYIDRDPLGLTAREYEVALLVCAELSDEEIARVLWVSTHTVKTHMKNIRGRVGARTRLGVAVAFAGVYGERERERIVDVLVERARLTGAERAAMQLVGRA